MPKSLVADWYDPKRDVSDAMEGDILTSGGQALVSNRQEYVVLGPGDSLSEDYYTREYAQRAIHAHDSSVIFVGVTGYGTVTGGMIGRRKIPSWAQAGFGGYRLHRVFDATYDPATNTFTAVGHGFVNARVFTVLSDDPATGLQRETLYFVVGQSGNNWQASLTEGGTAVDLTQGTLATLSIGAGIIQLWPAFVRAWTARGISPTMFFPQCGLNDSVGEGVSGAVAAARYSTFIDMILADYPEARIVMSDYHELLSGTFTGEVLAGHQANNAQLGAAIQELNKGPLVGFAPLSADIAPADMSSDGLHLYHPGARKKGAAYGRAYKQLVPVPRGEAYPPVQMKVAKTPAILVASDTQGAFSASYNNAFSPSRDSAGTVQSPHPGMIIGLSLYPTSLAEDSTFRNIISYGNTYPNGWAIGTNAGAGAAGGMTIYYGGSGAVIAGHVSSSFPARALTLNAWNEIAVIVDPRENLMGAYIGGELIVWGAIPTPYPAMTIQETLWLGYAGLSKTASLRAAQPGYYNDVWIAKGPHINMHTATELIRKRMFGRQFPAKTLCYWRMAAGTGTSEPSQVLNIPALTLQADTAWVAAASVPAKLWDE